MAKLTMTIGLPGSGKSTWAKKLVEQDKTGKTKRVNKDDLRAMIDKSWSKTNEQFVLRVRDSIVEEALSRYYDIIVDDTNFAPKHEERLKEIAKKYNADFEIKDFRNVPVEECIRRDLLRPVSVGERVIRQMYRQWLAPRSVPYVKPEGKPRAIMVDIDGTLAHMVPQSQGGRSPYDYSRVSEDVVDEVVRNIVRRYYDDGYQVLILSGRSASCQDDTIRWLMQNAVPYQYLWMRDADDSKRNDAIVKLELFDKYIRDGFQVEFVLDDRNRVVDMWRANGLKVLQVADGDF